MFFPESSGGDQVGTDGRRQPPVHRRGQRVSATPVVQSIRLALPDPRVLISPFAINPIYATGPAGHDAPGCTAYLSSWIVDGVTYEEQAGDGADSVSSKRLNLQVTFNPATGYQASCMANSDVDSTTAIPLTCAGYEFQDFRTIGRYSISTSGSTSLPSFNFSLSQTWYCSDVDASKP